MGSSVEMRAARLLEVGDVFSTDGGIVQLVELRGDVVHVELVCHGAHKEADLPAEQLCPLWVEGRKTAADRQSAFEQECDEKIASFRARHSKISSEGRAGAVVEPKNEALRRAFRFFHEHDGWSNPPGKAVCAIRSARAEALLDQAIELDAATFELLDDQEPWDEGTETSAEEASAKFQSGEWTGPFGCVLNVGDAHASLWGIVVGSRAQDDPYIRCVRAELAYELLDDLRQAVGDALDAQREEIQG